MVKFNMILGSVFCLSAYLSAVSVSQLVLSSLPPPPPQYLACFHSPQSGCFVIQYFGMEQLVLASTKVGLLNIYNR